MMGTIRITVVTVAMLMFYTVGQAQEQETKGDTWSNDHNYQRGTEKDAQSGENADGVAEQAIQDTDITEAADTVHEGIQEEMENVTDTVGQQEYDNRYERNKAADKLGKKVEKRARKVDEELKEEDASSPK